MQVAETKWSRVGIFGTFVNAALKNDVYKRPRKL